LIFIVNGFLRYFSSTIYQKYWGLGEKTMRLLSEKSTNLFSNPKNNKRRVIGENQKILKKNPSRYLKDNVIKMLKSLRYLIRPGIPREIAHALDC
jgi:hypothetical protein